MIKTDTIPKPDGNTEVIFEKNGATNDIVKVILETDKTDDKRFCRFASQFRGKGGLKKLWNFVKYKIQYKVDDFGTQDIKTPSALWSTGIGDCKSKTLFITQVLKCLGIDYVIRFTSYLNDKKFTHVYPVAILNGTELILDSVYHKYNKEKKYSYKKDYKTMTRIARISGLNMDKARAGVEAKYIVEEIKQKQDYIPDQEFISLKDKTAGEANLSLLRRQLILLRTFNMDNDKKRNLYNEGVAMVDREISAQAENPGKKAFISGIVPDELQNLAFAISKQSLNVRPAMNVQQAAKNNAMYNAISGQLISPGNRYLTNNNQNYVLGFNSPYQVSRNDISPALSAWLIDNLSKQAYDSSGQPLTTTVTNPFTGTTNTFPITRASLFSALSNQPLSGAEVQQFINIISNNPDAVWTNFVQGSTNPFVLNFEVNSYLQDMDKYIEVHSGVWDRYLNEVVYNESGEIGTGLFYDYADRVTSMSNYPLEVRLKKGFQSQWVDNLQFFTGTDREVLQNFGRNTFIHACGENPEVMLDDLLNIRRTGISGQPRVGLVLTAAGIAAIITALAPVVLGIINAIATSGRSRQTADQINPGQIPQNFTPLSLSQTTAEDDWTGEGSGEGSGQIIPGIDTTTLLGLGLLGFGAYQLTKK
jgi:hypothetical protein